ncbi:hypothetical protein [Actinoplanes sp. NPDC049802]|uniref:mechanosensitive ion channel family protein n=1 Tax=Actinoplanes sp. NPDC049802 TaxID=3154742 RepID=UPI0033CD476A
MTGDGLSRGVSDMWRSVVLYLPSILVFLVILIAGYLLARLARTITTRTLRRVGFDRAVQRGPAGRLLRPGAPSATDVCARLAFFLVLLFALQLAFGVFGPNPASELINALIAWLPRVFVGIVIVVVAAAIAGAAHDLILAVLGGLGYARVLAKSVAAVIVTLGVIAGLDQVGIATSVTRPLLVTILATVAGVIIVGVGGGLIRPMQQRWEGWLDRAAAESATIRDQARAYAEERARRAAEEPRTAASPPAAGAGVSSPEATVSAPAEPSSAATVSTPADPDVLSFPGATSPAGPSRVPDRAPAVTSESAGAPGPAGGRGGGVAVPAQPAEGRLDGRTPAWTPGTAGGGDGRAWAAGADSGRPGGDGAFPDEAEELAWEARWAEEERRSREPDSDETQVIVAPQPGGVGDERTTDLHASDGDEPTTAFRATGEKDTVFVSSGTAETTILTPGIRPNRAPATPAADEPETTALVTAGPSADDTTVIRSPGTEAGLTIVEESGEERTQVVPLPPASGTPVPAAGDGSASPGGADDPDRTVEGVTPSTGDGEPSARGRPAGPGQPGSA